MSLYATGIVRIITDPQLRAFESGTMVANFAGGIQEGKDKDGNWINNAIDGVTKSAHARVTFDCYATTRRVASSISKAIRETGIDFFRGTVDGYSFAGIDFDSADEYLNDTPTDGNQEHRYLVSFDLLVHYGEP